MCSALCLSSSRFYVCFLFRYDSFIAELTAHLPFMENSHLVLLMRNFVEQYVLNALPMFYPQVMPVFLVCLL